MNFSLAPWNVRLERFKPGGKWYDTFELNMKEEWELPPPIGVRKAMTRQNINLQPEWSVVVLDPYSENPYPIMIIGPA